MLDQEFVTGEECIDIGLYAKVVVMNLATVEKEKPHTLGFAPNDKGGSAPSLVPRL